MAHLRVVVALVLMVAWWQKDTLDDRAQSLDGHAAPWAQKASRAWTQWTPDSPAKAWVGARDRWLDNVFNPKRSYGVSPSEILTAQTPQAPTDRPPNAPVQERNAVAASTMPPEEAAASSFAPPSKPVAPVPAVITEESRSPLASVAAIKRILIAGDSMSGDVGLSLRQIAFKHKQKTGVDVSIIDAHRHSTGLVVLSYYDWPRELAGLLAKNEPQVVVFMVGANDGQSMRLANQSWTQPNTPAWSNEYERRAKDVIATVGDSTTLVWLDLPPVRMKSLQEKTSQVNSSVKNALLACKHCVYVETRSVFGGDAYVENTPASMLRAKDGIHYSRQGASYVASKIWSTLGFPEDETP